MSATRVALLLGALASVGAGLPAEAAKLTRVKGDRIEQYFPERPFRAEAMVTPSSGGSGAGVWTNLTVSNPPECAAASAQSWNEFLIEASEPEEQIGDCVLVRYNWSYAASVTTTGPDIDAQATLGGGAASFGCSLPVTTSCAGPSRIVVDPNGTPDVVYSWGPTAYNPGEGTDVDGTGFFAAAIGDTIRVESSAAAAVYGTEAGSSGSASGSASIGLTLERCRAEIPALGIVGLLSLALLLGIFAVLRLRS